MIGGLFSSTFLTLLIVPVVYSLVEGGWSAASRRFDGRSEEPVPASAPAGA